MPGVYLFSSDGISDPIYLDDEAAKLSAAIQEYRQSFLSNFIRLEYEEFTKEALSLVADFCKTHAADVDVSEWTSNLKNLDLTELLDIMKAAKFLQIEGLMGFCNTAGRRKSGFGQKLPDEFFEIQEEDNEIAKIQMDRKKEEEVRKIREIWQRKEQEAIMKLEMARQKEEEEEEEETRILDELLHRAIDNQTLLESTEDQEEEDQEEHINVEESTQDQEEEDQEEHGIVEESTEEQEEGGNEDSG